MELHQFFKAFHDLSDKDFELLTAKFKTKHFKKGEYLCFPGQVQKELYFIKSGVQMSFF